MANARTYITFRRIADNDMNEDGMIYERSVSWTLQLRRDKQAPRWVWTNDERGIVCRNRFFCFTYYRDRAWEQRTRP